MTTEAAIQYHELDRSAMAQEPPPSRTTLGLLDQLLLEDAARELAARIAQINTARDWMAWRSSHQNVLAAIYRVLPDCPARNRLTQAGRTAKATFARSPIRTHIPKKAQARGGRRGST